MMSNVQVTPAKRRMSKSALSGFDHGSQEENPMEHFTAYFKS